MKTSYDTTAFAKINLFLRCCGKYDNGYHRLYMLMQQIGLGDDIFIEFDDDRDFAIGIESGVDIPPEKDLGYKAAKAFYDCYTDKLRAEAKPVPRFPYTFIKETKNVPSQAGLGGGSSDAAAVLQILQQHFGNPLTDEQMIMTAAKLGADVPFFLCGGTALCEGVGEILTPMPDLSGLPMLLLKPQRGVSTPFCYKAFDAMGAENIREEEKKARELRDRLKETEQAISKAEEEAGGLEAALADPETWKDPDAAAEMTRKYNALKDRIEELYEQYEALESVQ